MTALVVILGAMIVGGIVLGIFEIVKAGKELRAMDAKANGWASKPVPPGHIGFIGGSIGPLPENPTNLETIAHAVAVTHWSGDIGDRWMELLPADYDREAAREKDRHLAEFASRKTPA